LIGFGFFGAIRRVKIKGKIAKIGARTRNTPINSQCSSSIFTPQNPERFIIGRNISHLDIPRASMAQILPQKGSILMGDKFVSNVG
jgi:hypothetical protein